MKTILALLATCFLSLAHAQTNQRSWDVRLSISGGTYPYLQDGGRFLQLHVLGPEFVENAYAADMLYQTKNPKIKIGIATSYIKVQQYRYGGFSWTPTSEGKHVIASEKITAVMPAFNYSYLIRKKSQLYSQVSVGAAFKTHKFYDKPATAHSIDPAFQCTFLGYRLGTRIGAFAEAGYGYKGILQLGISGTF
jgi:hypothetical protein